MRGTAQRLRQMQWHQRMDHSVNAQIIKERLRARLGDEVIEKIEQEWEGLPDTMAYLPCQRLDFLIKKANEYGHLDVVPMRVFTN